MVLKWTLHVFFRTCQLAHVMDLSSVAVILKDFETALRSKRHDHGEHLASCLDRQRLLEFWRVPFFGTEIPILDSKDPQQNEPPKIRFLRARCLCFEEGSQHYLRRFSCLKSCQVEKTSVFFTVCSWKLKMMLPKIRLMDFLGCPALKWRVSATLWSFKFNSSRSFTLRVMQLVGAMGLNMFGCVFKM